MATSGKPVIFIIDSASPRSNQIPLSDNSRDTTDALTAEFYPTLVSILGSPLNQAGKVNKVYINFRSKGWFEVEPTADVDSVLLFQDRLQTLFAEGVLRMTGTDQVTWRLVEDDLALIDGLPADKLIIGCVSGPYEEPRRLQDFLDAAIDENTFVFVVGRNIRHGHIAPEIDNYVNVSEYKVESYTKVARIACGLERKWNIM